MGNGVLGEDQEVAEHDKIRRTDPEVRMAEVINEKLLDLYSFLRRFYNSWTFCRCLTIKRNVHCGLLT